MLRMRSSLFVSALFLPEGLEMRWDGRARLYADAPAEMGKNMELGGLCGDMNGRTCDDMATPEGDVEHDVVAFAERCEHLFFPNLESLNFDFFSVGGPRQSASTRTAGAEPASPTARTRRWRRRFAEGSSRKRSEVRRYFFF